MNKILLMLAIGCAIGSCKPTAADFKTIEWFAGGGALKVTKTFEASRHGQVLLALDNSSLCKNSGVRVLVRANDNVVYEKTLAEFPVNEQWDVPSGAAMTVTTTVVGVDSTIQCIRLGDVRVTVKY